MDDLIKQLAHARAIAAEEKGWVEQYQQRLEKTPEWDTLQQQKASLTEINAGIAQLEEQVRKAAVAQFREDGDSEPHPAVKVKTYTVLIYDEEAAIDWSAEHARKCLKLNKREFEKVAKVMKPGCVQITTEPRATIRRELSDYVD